MPLSETTAGVGPGADRSRIRGSIRIVCFPRAYKDGKRYFIDDNAVLVRGKVDTRDDELQLVVENIWQPDLVDDEQSIEKNAVEITIPRETDKKDLQKLGTLLRKSPGNVPIVLLIPSPEGDHITRMKLPYTVAWSDDMAGFVKELLN